MQRRAILGGLAGILAAGFAPAAIGSGVLMPVRKIILPPSVFELNRKLEALARITDELLFSPRVWVIPPATAARLEGLSLRNDVVVSDLLLR